MDVCLFGSGPFCPDAARRLLDLGCPCDIAGAVVRAEADTAASQEDAERWRPVQPGHSLWFIRPTEDCM